MNETPYRQLTRLRVRIDECDATRAVTPGRLFGLADEARFDLYEALLARDVPLPTRQAAKAERLRVTRWPRSRESIAIEAVIARLGTTSFDVAHRILDADGATLAELRSTLVALPEHDGTPARLDERLRPHRVEGVDPALEPPGEPDNSLAFLRTIDAWPGHENQGGHVARTRMIDWLADAQRIGVARGAFERTHPSDGGPLVALSLVYERESFAGDGLRIAIAGAGPGVFDAALIRGGVVVTRARLRTHA